MKRNTKGFTLIELLIVVVIIGILAAIAIPKFAATKERAYTATMKTDLKNLATAQEGYAGNSGGAYLANTWNSPVTVPTDSAAGYTPSAGVKIVATTASASGTAPGWAATATSSYTGKKCYIFVGNIASPDATVAKNDAAPACDP